MEAPTRDLRTRRWIGRLIRVGLVLVAVVFLVNWGWSKVGGHGVVFRGDRNTRTMGGVSGVERTVTDASLGPGDMRVYNRDSTVDLVLRGTEVLAGLSPKTVAKVQGELAKGSEGDANGLGGLIASTVKQTVSNTIGTHVVYPLSNIRNIRYEDGQLVIEQMSGQETKLFGNSKVNGREVGKLFERAEAEKFIEAVRARKHEIEGR